ncbi:hypothetical protein LJB99_03000 [Deltaproteobacteria bacterium OttesenSCG-928-K17]|nr:hypothetical protein [Deltaproteobacteria bacterium OttesenSCG-928-K17]
MFDYSGYSAERIEKLSNLNLAYRGLNKRVYWSSENYSIGPALRSYAGEFPSHLPLYIYSHHGVSPDPRPRPHELKTTAEAMVVWNSDSLEHFRREMSIPCYQVTMPYVWYRREKGLNQVEGAKGTLVMPIHSTPQVDVVFDVGKYIDEMMALPSEYHPICFCLGAADIAKGLHRAFISRGVPVYTAGHGEDVRFIDRLYGLIRNFKYTMSNFAGSSAYYSVEMGIPFSLYGDLPELVNHTNPNREKGKVDLVGDPYVLEAQRIFKGLNTVISREQDEYTKKVLGIGEGLSREEFNDLLWRAYKKRGNRILDTISAARRKIKYWFRGVCPS